jgi:hypothetical protein
MTLDTSPKVDMTTTTGSEVPEVLPMGDTTSAGGGAAMIGGGATMIGDGDGDSDELEVVMGHPGL